MSMTNSTAIVASPCAPMFAVSEVGPRVAVRPRVAPIAMTGLGSKSVFGTPSVNGPLAGSIGTDAHVRDAKQAAPPRGEPR